MSQRGHDLNEAGPPPVIGSVPNASWGDRAFFEDFRTCIVDAGLGEFAGDTPEEVELIRLNQEAATQCLRERGWSLADPQLVPNRDYVLMAEVSVPANADQALLEADILDCRSIADEAYDVWGGE